MHSMPLFAQMDEFRMHPEHVFTYVSFTIGVLFLAWLVDARTRPLGTTFILWGILVVILSCGYGLIGIPTALMMTPALTKIGFLLVLGGIAWSLLAACPSPKATKEADHD